VVHRGPLVGTTSELFAAVHAIQGRWLGPVYVNALHSTACKPANTLRFYLGAIDELAGWVANNGPDDLRKLTRTDLALFMAAMNPYCRRKGSRCWVNGAGRGIEGVAARMGDP